MNPFGLAFSLIRSSDLIRVSEQGDIIEGGEIKLLNTAAFMIHSAIHKARPDVMAAAHSHSIYGRAFCTLGRTLDTITQDSCAFHDVWWKTCINRQSLTHLLGPRSLRLFQWCRAGGRGRQEHCSNARK